MLNVFTLANGRLFQEEIESLDALADVQPVWVDLEAPTAEEKGWIAAALRPDDPRATSSTTTSRNRPASTRKTTASCTSAPTS